MWGAMFPINPPLNTVMHRICNNGTYIVGFAQSIDNRHVQIWRLWMAMFSYLWLCDCRPFFGTQKRIEWTTNHAESKVTEQ